MRLGFFLAAKLLFKSKTILIEFEHTPSWEYNDITITGSWLLTHTYLSQTPQNNWHLHLKAGLQWAQAVLSNYHNSQRCVFLTEGGCRCVSIGTRHSSDAWRHYLSVGGRRGGTGGGLGSGQVPLFHKEPWGLFLSLHGGEREERS